MQQEGYDNWEGFVSAGFAAEDDGGIHLAGAKGWCSVWRTDAAKCRVGCWDEEKHAWAFD